MLIYNICNNCKGCKSIIRRISTTSSSSKKNSSESSAWLKRHVKDQYVIQARHDNYRARSAYKLLEIQKRHKLLRPGQTVLECGAAPGAWTQVSTELVGPSGLVVACDLLDFEPVKGAVILPNSDFTLPETQSVIQSNLQGRKLNLVLSDMAPNMSGTQTMDHDMITNLAYSVLKFSIQHSDNNSYILMKIFNGSNLPKLLSDVGRFYGSVKQVKPSSSRKESSEIYILASMFKASGNKFNGR